MATLTKTVDKTHVNGSEVFIYDFNVSYSGLSSPTAVGKLVDFFPSKIQFSLPPIAGQIVAITQTPVVGGHNVTFDFGTVTAGTSISFNMSCHYAHGRVDNDTFTNVANLYADGAIVATQTAKTVNLKLDENFTAVKSGNITGAVRPNQEIVFNVTLNNLNDPGANINNIIITDILPPSLIPITTFLPIGRDVSVTGYSDHTYDGLTGTWTGNTLNFALPSYHGDAYAVQFKVTVAANAVAGSTITNVAKWSVSGKARPDAMTNFRVFIEEASVSFVKTAPQFGTIGGAIQYSAKYYNTGTVTLNNCTIIDTIPPEIDILKVSGNAVPSTTDIYSLSFMSSDAPGVYKAVAINLVGVSAVYDLTSLMPSGARVLAVRLIANATKPNNVLTILTMQGVVNNSATTGQSVVNTAAFAGTPASMAVVNGSSSATTIMNGRSVLNISKSFAPSMPVYYPLGEFYVQLITFNHTGAVVNPVYADLLPIGLDAAVVGDDIYQYFSLLSNTLYDSREPNYPYPLPNKEIIRNYKGTGRTLVRLTFNGMTVLSEDNFRVAFAVIALLNPPATVVNVAYLGNPGSNAQVYNSAAYIDVLDVDGDGITNETIAQSNVVTANILSTSEFSLEKWTKGNMATAFTKATQVTGGGDIVYELNVTNNQETELRNIEVVDILPYVGDTGVILSGVARGSQYEVYATSIVTAQIINVLGDPVIPPMIKIEYSISNDPVRFNETGTGTIGTGAWSTAPPSDITTLRSIKVTTAPSVVLKPYQRLIVTINAKAPVNATVNLLAYNSYAVRADRVNGSVTTPMNPAEPNKVSAQIVAASKASIGRFVWEDINGNGKYDVGEPGINGVVIELYSATMTLLKTTVTSNDGTGNAGYYNFTGLNAGVYYVKFISPSGYTITVQNIIDASGSRPNPITGLTNAITLVERQNDTSVNAGLIGAKCAPPTIIAANKCVVVFAQFDAMAGVSATDCKGNDITAKVIITANSVNTQQAGIYHVTYSVTDSHEQTTTRTITVKVCESGKYAQAISDIIESVALEQTALSHILNAEGEKLQRAIELKYDSVNLIKINKSIKNMVRTIINLETVLLGKLALVKGGGSNCCDE